MSYEWIDRAKAALAKGNVQGALAEAFGRDEAETALLDTPFRLRQWASAEQSQGYGLRAEILERLAEVKNG